WPFSVRSFRGFLTLLVLAAAGEAEAFAIHLENVDVVGQPVEQGPGEAFGAKHPVIRLKSMG
ncbi:hypothetical protein LH128_25678, partial [Sphingomonas sp. LH128]